MKRNSSCIYSGYVVSSASLEQECRTIVLRGIGGCEMYDSVKYALDHVVDTLKRRKHEHIEVKLPWTAVVDGSGDYGDEYEFCAPVCSPGGYAGSVLHVLLRHVACRKITKAEVKSVVKGKNK